MPMLPFRSTARASTLRSPRALPPAVVPTLRVFGTLLLLQVPRLLGLRPRFRAPASIMEEHMEEDIRSTEQATNPIQQPGDKEAEGSRPRK
jgi:hypothetical protein